MVFEPHNKVLDRGPRGDDSIRDRFAGLIDRCVNFGSHITPWLLAGETVPAPRFTMALMLRHLLSQLDGVAVLLRTGCPEPIKVVLRTVFEAYLNISYLLRADTERRAMCYSLSAKHRSIALVRRRDETTETGRRLAVALQKDESGFKGPLASVDEFPALADMEAELTTGPLVPLETEWQRLKKSGIAPHWYQLFGGPNNLEALATEVGWTTTNPDVLRGCQYLGPVKTHASGWRGGLAAEKTEKTIRNKTAKVGGNVVFMTTSGAQSTGEAYRCQSPTER